MAQDRIWYHGQLSGSDIGLVYNGDGVQGATAVYFIPGTNTDRLGYVYLDEENPNVSGNNVKAGTKGDKGRLDMYCADVYSILFTN